MKKCSYCSELKPISAFGYSSRAPDGREYSCKECRSLIVRAWSKRNPGKVIEKNKKNRKLRKYIRFGKDDSVRCRDQNAKLRRQRYFGVTAAEYEKMSAAQDDKCAICKRAEVQRHQSGKIKTLAIDHDHDTGAIRELLCARCNSALGSFRDDPALLEAAVAYLKKHRESPGRKLVSFKLPSPGSIATETAASEANWTTT